MAMMVVNGDDVDDGDDGDDRDEWLQCKVFRAGPWVGEIRRSQQPH